VVVSRILMASPGMGLFTLKVLILSFIKLTFHLWLSKVQLAGLDIKGAFWN